jgi:hypothetical protein
VCTPHLAGEVFYRNFYNKTPFPKLYQKGFSILDLSKALLTLLVDGAKWLLSNVVSRLKGQRSDE